jgi:hypothetical protein
VTKIQAIRPDHSLPDHYKMECNDHYDLGSAPLEMLVISITNHSFTPHARSGRISSCLSSVVSIQTLA